MKTIAVILAITAIARAASSPVMEKQLLFGGMSIKGWSPAESTVEISRARLKGGDAALHWHVPVDYYHGEPKYPIGWPRFGHAIPDGPQRDWSAWDYLHMWIYTSASRSTLPRDPAGLGIQAPDRAHTFNLSLTELKLGEWVEIKIPSSKIGRPDDVRNIQFHISEANYKHGDQLDFYIDDLALLRYAQPTILDFAAETAAMFADAKTVAAQFQLLGINPGDTVPVTCELRREGRVVACATLQATRGPQRVTIGLGHDGLVPGIYELTACAGAGQPVPPATVRVVESPWRE